MKHRGLRTYVGFFVAGFAAAAAVVPLSMVSTSRAAAPAGGSGPYASDSFARTVSNGWGTADAGGAWTQVKGTASDMSVDGSSGVFAIPADYYLNAEQIAALQSTSALDYVGQYVVTFSENINNYSPQYGGVCAYLVARYQNASATGYYRLGLVWDAGTRRLFLRTQNPAGKGAQSNFTIERNTGIDPTKDFASAPYAYNVKVQIVGSKPTTFASKVWKAGSTEPSGWMLTGSDPNNLGPQVAGPIGFRGSNDLQSSASHFITSYTAHIHVSGVGVGPVAGAPPATNGTPTPPKSNPAPAPAPVPVAPVAPAAAAPAPVPLPLPVVHAPPAASAPSAARAAAPIAIAPPVGSAPAPAPAAPSSPTTASVVHNPVAAVSTDWSHGNQKSAAPSSGLTAATAGSSRSSHLLGLGGSFLLGAVVFVAVVMVWQRGGRGAHSKSRGSRRRWAV